MNKHKTTMLAAALAMALSGAAFAGDKGNKHVDPMATDTMTDTSVDATVDTTVDTVDPLDADVNHGQTVSEYAKSQPEMTPPDSPPGQSISQVAQGQGNWNQLDADRDGLLDESEINADADLTASLSTYDSDGDGQLSRAEFDAYTLASANGELDTGELDPELDADVDAEVDTEVADTDIDADVDADLDAEDDL